jgi:hypothetical protein
MIDCAAPPEAAQGEVTPDARELHRVITASMRELLETAHGVGGEGENNGIRDVDR